jgi:hypothetical protein
MAGVEDEVVGEVSVRLLRHFGGVSEMAGALASIKLDDTPQHPRYHCIAEIQGIRRYGGPFACAIQ